MVSIETARNLLGPNFHGIDDVQRHFGVTYALAQLQTIPFNGETLHECKDTHLLIPGAPLSLLDLRDRYPSRFSSKKPAWYDSKFDRDWVQLQVEPRWYLLRKEPVPESYDKTYPQQTALLTDEEEVPQACEMTYAILLHQLVTGQCLFSECHVRCVDMTWDGYRVVVGIDSNGFLVDGFSDGCRDSRIGLASSRKPELAS